MLCICLNSIMKILGGNLMHKGERTSYRSFHGVRAQGEEACGRPRCAAGGGADELWGTASPPTPDDANPFPRVEPPTRPAWGLPLGGPPVAGVPAAGVPAAGLPRKQLNLVYAGSTREAPQAAASRLPDARGSVAVAVGRASRGRDVQVTRVSGLFVLQSSPCSKHVFSNEPCLEKHAMLLQVYKLL